MEDKRISAEKLHGFLQTVFAKAGFPAEISAEAANTLLLADLRGIESHGSARFGGYLRLAEAGLINPNARPRIVHETPSTATLDADGGLGLWIGKFAMRIALEKAKVAGSGWVAVKNSSHFGIAAAHAELAIRQDCIGFALTNASPLVAPAGAVEPYLGTNPICYAIPNGTDTPFISDLATTAVANGKLEVAHRKGERIPEGWAQSATGEPTDDPLILKSGGTMLPLGSDAAHSYHKGYALGSVVDILSGVLSGANFGMWVPPFVSFLGQKERVGEGIGHFLGAWRVDAFSPKEVFYRRMQQWHDGAKSRRRREGVEEILIPGEIEHRMESRRRIEGILLNAKVREEIQAIGVRLGVAL